MRVQQIGLKCAHPLNPSNPWLKNLNSVISGLGGSFDGESKFFQHLFSHPEFLNLSGYGHRKLRSETDVTWNLVSCDLAAAVVTDFVGRGFLSIMQPDPGTH